MTEALLTLAFLAGLLSSMLSYRRGHRDGSKALADAVRAELANVTPRDA